MAEKAQNFVHVNGIDWETGAEALPPIPVEQFFDQVVRRYLESAKAKYPIDLGRRQKEAPVSFSFSPGQDINRLDEAGWGLILPQGMEENQRTNVLAALGPLIRHRQDQLGGEARIFDRETGVRPQDTTLDYLNRLGLPTGMVDPQRLPYYLLLVGDPEQISFGFQQELGLTNAVGRLPFTDPETLARYATAIVEYETNPQPALQRGAAIFMPGRGEAHIYASQTSQPITTLTGEAAHQTAFLDLLSNRAGPAVIYAHTQGLTLAGEDSRLRALQGALLAYDFPSGYPTGVPERPDRLRGVISAESLPSPERPSRKFFLLAGSFAAGSEPTDELVEARLSRPGNISPFVSALAHKLVADYALGVIAPTGWLYDSTPSGWSYASSDRKDTQASQTLDLTGMMDDLLTGRPVGASLEIRTQPDMWPHMLDLLTERNPSPEGDDRTPEALAYLFATTIVGLRTILFGDPYARLAQMQAYPTEKEIETTIGHSTAPGDTPQAPYSVEFIEGLRKRLAESELAIQEAKNIPSPILRKMLGLRDYVRSYLEREEYSQAYQDLNYLTDLWRRWSTEAADWSDVFTRLDQLRKDITALAASQDLRHILRQQVKELSNQAEGLENLAELNDSLTDLENKLKQYKELDNLLIDLYNTENENDPAKAQDTLEQYRQRLDAFASEAYDPRNFARLERELKQRLTKAQPEGGAQEAASPASKILPGSWSLAEPLYAGGQSHLTFELTNQIGEGLPVGTPLSFTLAWTGQDNKSQKDAAYTMGLEEWFPAGGRHLVGRNVDIPEQPGKYQVSLSAHLRRDLEVTFEPQVFVVLPAQVDTPPAEPQFWLVVATGKPTDWVEEFARAADQKEPRRIPWRRVNSEPGSTHQRQSRVGDYILAYQSSGKNHFLAGLGQIAAKVDDPNDAQPLTIELLYPFQQPVTLDELKEHLGDLEKVSNPNVTFSEVTPEQWAVVYHWLAARNPGLGPRLPKSPVAERIALDIRQWTLEPLSQLVGANVTLKLTLVNTGNTPLQTGAVSGILRWQRQKPPGQAETPFQIEIETALLPRWEQELPARPIVPDQQGENQVSMALTLTGMGEISAPETQMITVMPVESPLSADATALLKNIDELERAIGADGQLPSWTRENLTGRLAMVRGLVARDELAPAGRQFKIIDAAWGDWQNTREDRLGQLADLARLREELETTSLPTHEKQRLERTFDRPEALVVDLSRTVDEAGKAIAEVTERLGLAEKTTRLTQLVALVDVVWARQALESDLQSIYNQLPTAEPDAIETVLGNLDVCLTKILPLLTIYNSIYSGFGENNPAASAAFEAAFRPRLMSIISSKQIEPAQLEQLQHEMIDFQPTGVESEQAGIQMITRRIDELENLAQGDPQLPKESLAVLDPHFKAARDSLASSDSATAQEELSILEGYWNAWAAERDARLGLELKLSELRSQIKSLPSASRMRRALLRQWNGLVEAYHRLEAVGQIEAGLEKLGWRTALARPAEDLYRQTGKSEPPAVRQLWEDKLRALTERILKDDDLEAVEAELKQQADRQNELASVLQAYHTNYTAWLNHDMKTAAEFRAEFEPRLAYAAQHPVDAAVLTRFQTEMGAFSGGKPGEGNGAPPSKPTLEIIKVDMTSPLLPGTTGEARLELRCSVPLPAGSVLQFVHRLSRVSQTSTEQLTAELAAGTLYTSNPITLNAPKATTRKVYTVTFQANLPALAISASPVRAELVVDPQAEKEAPKAPERKIDFPADRQTGLQTVAQVYQSTAVVYASMQPYLPPPPAQERLLIDIRRDEIEVEYQPGIGEEKEYRGKNLLNEIPADGNGINIPADFGKRLFDRLLNDQPFSEEYKDRHPRAGWRFILDKTDLRNLTIELHLSDENAYAYPWEMLADPDGRPLAVREDLPFFRRYGPGLEVDPLPADPLKVLFVIPDPQDLLDPFGDPPPVEWLEKCDGEDEPPPVIAKARRSLRRVDIAYNTGLIHQALDDIQDGLLHYDLLLGGPANAPLTWERVKKSLLDGGYHAVHFLAHGVDLAQEAPAKKFAIILENEAHCAAPLYQDEFVTLFRDAGLSNLRLATLAVCHSANQTLRDQAHQTLAQRLILDGKIPAVIAMRATIEINAAQMLTSRFYSDLARSGRVDTAMAATRFAVYDTAPDRYDWSVPVLMLGANSPHLFEIPVARVRQKPRPTQQELKDQLKNYAQLTNSQGQALEAARRNFQSLGLNADQNLMENINLAFNGQPVQPPANRPIRPVPRQERQELERLGWPVDIRAAELKAYCAERTRLILDNEVYYQVASSLNAGKHLILTGAPGVAKTTLARAICEFASGLRPGSNDTLTQAAEDKRYTPGYRLTTATADWTTFDTVGGYTPAPDQTLHFRPGVFLEAVRQARWLVIDEINRAEIDKAFGELFTVLSGQQVDLPYEVDGGLVRILPSRPPGELKPGENWWPVEARSTGYDIVVHPNWRIIGTMNVYDKSSLFQMSFAFMRRFAFIELDLPGDADYRSLVQRWLGELVFDLKPDDPAVGDVQAWKALEEKLCEILKHERPVIIQPAAGEGQPGAAETTRTQTEKPPLNTLMKNRAIGPGIVRDMLAYIGDRAAQPVIQSGANPANETRLDAQKMLPVHALDYLADAFSLWVIPQLDALDPQAIKRIHLQVGKWFGDSPRCARIRERMHLLYPHLERWDDVEAEFYE